MKARMARFPTRKSLLAAAVLAAATSVAARAEAACPAYPSDVPGWEGLSHAAVVGYVDSQFANDWQRYEDALIASLNALTEIHRSSGVAVVDGGRRLAGAELGRYIDRLTQRIGITRCLARTESARVAAVEAPTGRSEQVAAFETAAGDAPATQAETAAPRTLPTASASDGDAGSRLALGSGDFRVDVRTQCQGDQGMLRIVNSGPKWPGRARLVIRDAAAPDDKPVALRMLRMVEGQTATFYVDRSLGLIVSIVPTWGGGELVRELPPSCSGGA